MSLLSNLKEFRNIKPCWASFSSNSLFGTKSKYKDNWTSRPLTGQTTGAKSQIAAVDVTYELTPNQSQLLKGFSVGKIESAAALCSSGDSKAGELFVGLFSSASYYPENLQSSSISWTPFFE